MPHFVFGESPHCDTFVTLDDRGIDPDPVHAKFPPKERGSTEFSVPS
jgi:hypothetical protein